MPIVNVSKNDITINNSLVAFLYDYKNLNCLCLKLTTICISPIQRTLLCYT